MATPAKVTLASAKLSIEDVCAVAALRARVVLDAPASTNTEAVRAAAVDPDAPLETQLRDLALVHDLGSATLASITRAVLLVLAHRLLKLKPTAAATETTQLLVALLNHDVLPLMASGADDVAALTVLAAAEGRGVARVNGAVVPLRQALSDASIELPSAPLGTSEKHALAQAPIMLLAVSTLAIGGARGLLPLADAVAALSCESLRANTAPFAAEFVDASRPHRGVVTSATNLRLMLESSKYVNARKELSLDADCVRYIPQYHGPARDTVTNAFKTLELELNAAVATDSAVVKTAGDFHPQALKTALKPTLDAMQVLLRGTNERRLAADASATPLKPASMCAIELVETVTRALVAEAQLALAFFDAEEEELKAKLAEKNAKAQEAAAKAAAAQAKEDEKLAAMTEAQRAKVMEKRQKKLDKLKEKESAKMVAKDDVKIGAGSSAVRQYLQGFDDWTTRVTAFDLRAGGTALFLDDLFVRLGSGGARRKPKIAKGSQDFLPHQMQLREKIFNKIRMVFKRHAGVEIETPVFELKETLTGKYGEDSKLIYDLADQGGELLALRYDLTVPFARFMALHNPGNIKRYHIARVYRRDNPQMARGRFREFYQCDFDIAGTYAPMMADAEVLSIGIEVLQQFPAELGPFKVKLSHRLLLDAILAICGVPPEKFRTTCSAIDKLDKEPWAAVRSEMVDEKGLPEHVADRIEHFVCRVGAPRALHAELVAANLFGDNANAKTAMDELALLFGYLDAMGVLDYVSFDLSLARGLDYYTGLIYEFVLTSPEHNVGSIAAGGRYDNLVGMFSATGQQIPCVGVSLGIERIFGILQAHAEKTSRVATPTAHVLVASTGGALALPRLELCKELWRANIAAEIMQLENPKFTKQLHYALEAGIPFMVVVGEDELAKGEVKIKEMLSKDEVTVPRSELVAELLRRNCPTTDTLSV